MGWRDWIAGDEGWVPDAFTGGKPTRQALSRDSLIGELEDNRNAIKDTIAENTPNYYEDISRAETGSYDNPWIRTTLAGSGSSAYGPAQLTGTTAKHYRDKPEMNWSEEEMDYLNRFGNQADMFLEVGGSDMEKSLALRGLEGQQAEEFKKTWDYGGSGALGHTQMDKDMYKQVVSKMMGDISGRTGDDKEAFWREWRFGETGAKDLAGNVDVEYGKRFMGT